MARPARRCCERGARTVVFTRGEGARRSCRRADRRWELTPPQFEGGASEGSGDSMVGAMCAALARGPRHRGRAAAGCRRGRRPTSCATASAAATAPCRGARQEGEAARAVAARLGRRPARTAADVLAAQHRRRAVGRDPVEVRPQRSSISASRSTALGDLHRPPDGGRVRVGAEQRAAGRPRASSQQGGGGRPVGDVGRRRLHQRAMLDQLGGRARGSPRRVTLRVGDEARGSRGGAAVSTSCDQVIVERARAAARPAASCPPTPSDTRRSSSSVEPIRSARPRSRRPVRSAPGRPPARGAALATATSISSSRDLDVVVVADVRGRARSPRSRRRGLAGHGDGVGDVARPVVEAREGGGSGGRS